MQTNKIQQLKDSAPILGELILYPNADHWRVAAQGVSAFAQVSARIAEALVGHVEEWGKETISSLQEAYTQTFDVTPRCTLLMSVHLFGVESFDRARMMVGLAEEYERVQFSGGQELPDHLGVMLSAARAMGEAEWVDLVVFGIAPALPRVARLLDDPRAPNRWRYVVRGITALVEEVVEASGLTPPAPPPLGFAKEQTKSVSEQGEIHA
jgi:nitrate reductase assembly molybdenum cofactor insertion protein NarJ